MHRIFYCATKGLAAIVIASASTAGIVAPAVTTAGKDKDKDNYPSAAAAAK